MHSIRVSRVWWILGVLLVIGLVVILIWVLYPRESLVDDSLLTGVPCDAPCWQGIIPGETPQSQAMQILKSSPYILQSSLQETGTSQDGGAVWHWRAPGRRLQPSIVWEDDVVQEITLGLTYNLTVDQLISKFGIPEAINVSAGGTPEHWYWIIDFYYPHIGVQFKAYTSEFDDSLEPHDEVGVAHFFAPTSLEERVVDVYGYGEDASAENIVSHVMSLMRVWEGYGDLFELYYKSTQELELGE
jgi:hypothetical protein